MSNYEIAELTWENGELGMNGLSGFLQPKPTAEWSNRTSEKLESIVHQATWQKNPGEKRAETSSGHQQAGAKKRIRSESNGGTGTGMLSMNGSNCMQVMSGRGSHERNSMSWANSFDSSPSFKHKTTTFEESASLGGSENQDEDGETKTETVRSGSGSGSSRRSRAAAVHNLSERRRRDRINQKMKALQKLVPNASKTDKASILDEVIEYLKQLQAQVQIMNSARHLPQMMMSLGMQHHLHMNLVSRMGMPSNNTTPFLPPPFILPSSVLQPHPALPPPPPPPPQSMNMEIYNKMAEVYLQQMMNQATHGTTNQ